MHSLSIRCPRLDSEPSGTAMAAVIPFHEACARLAHAQPAPAREEDGTRSPTAVDAFADLLRSFATEADLLPHTPAPLTLRHQVSNMIRTTMASGSCAYRAWPFLNSLLATPSSPFNWATKELDPLYDTVYTRLTATDNTDMVAWLRTLATPTTDVFGEAPACGCGTRSEPYTAFLHEMRQAGIDTASPQYCGAMLHMYVIARHGIVAWKARQLGYY